jgi:hypothetical protein
MKAEPPVTMETELPLAMKGVAAERERLERMIVNAAFVREMGLSRAVPVRVSGEERGTVEFIPLQLRREGPKTATGPRERSQRDIGVRVKGGNGKRGGNLEGKCR